MNTPAVYDLHWKSIPMGAIQGYADWYDPYLGSGIYMFVLAKTEYATKDDRYSGFYIGKSDDIGRRWREHLRDWFLDPKEGYWIVDSAEAFLKDPVGVINSGVWIQGNPDSKKIQSRILGKTWFVFGEVHDHGPRPLLEDLEYVLQEGLKKHAGIARNGYIGDAPNRRSPAIPLAIRNHFGRSFLSPTLPREIHYAPDRGVSL